MDPDVDKAIGTVKGQSLLPFGIHGTADTCPGYGNVMTWSLLQFECSR